MERHSRSISPLDGRYRNLTSELLSYFSEDAHYRRCIEIELSYFEFVCSVIKGKNISISADHYLEEAVSSIAHYETIFKHDIKAVEYAVRDIIKSHDLGDLIEMVHYGLTSQDIVSLSVNSRLRDFIDRVVIPHVKTFISSIENIDAQGTYIYCRTHGQVGNITVFNCEMTKFGTRLRHLIDKLESMKWWCKFSGSNGNMSSMEIIHGDIMIREQVENWLKERYNFNLSDWSTQTDNWVSLCECFSILNDMSNILIDLCRDLWIYYMNGDISYKNLNKSQVGSSVMPSKINPIAIENCEGNMEMFGMWATFFINKFPKSRLQRDLTDSVVIRHIGIPLSNFTLGLKTLNKDILNIECNGIQGGLDYSVFGEVLQTLMRLKGIDESYMKIKDLFRTGKKMSKETFIKIVMNVMPDGSDDLFDYMSSVESNI